MFGLLWCRKVKRMCGVLQASPEAVHATQWRHALVRLHFARVSLPAPALVGLHLALVDLHLALVLVLVLVLVPVKLLHRVLEDWVLSQHWVNRGGSSSTLCLIPW